MAGKTKAREAASDDTSMQDVPPSAQKPGESTDSMVEDAENEEGDEEEEEEEEEEPQRLKILPGSTETAASFEFEKEGHTLGNALRYIIMKNPEVEFCAYAIPHPSEDKMNIRIQTYDGTTAVEALQKGLQDLEDLCDVVTDEFTIARDAFNGTKA